MRLRVDPRTGDVVLSFPHRLPRRHAIEWAAKQREWIDAALAGVPAAVPLTRGATIPWQGMPHRIEWTAARSRSVIVEPGRIGVGGPAELAERRLLRWMKSEALATLTRETREFADLAGIGVDKVGIGDPTSRWGAAAPPAGRDTL